jgi:hypothetical protein
LSRRRDLHIQATKAKTVEATALYNAAARLMAEFRKTSLALREYRTVGAKAEEVSKSLSPGGLPKTPESAALMRISNPFLYAPAPFETEYMKLRPQGLLPGSTCCRTTASKVERRPSAAADGWVNPVVTGLFLVRWPPIAVPWRQD